MPEAERFDLVVVGGGNAGKSLAMDLARSGKRVAMVERGMIGGTCINVACIPTKALVTSARLLRTARRAADFGLEGVDPLVSLERLRAHKEGVVADMVALNRKQFADSGLELLLGEASFVGERTVSVALDDGGERVIRGADVLVNTGLVPFVPPIDGLREAKPLTSETLLRLSELPESLLVIGGGVIGAEFASMLATFGVRVTVIEGGPQILGREDADTAAFALRRFREDGIDVRLGARVVRASRDGGRVTAELVGGEVLTAAEVLVAVGRAPHHGGLNLQAAGIEVDARGFVKVDEHLHSTSAPHVWAAGDIAGSPQFTHVSWDDYRIVKANLAGGSRSTRDRLVAYTVFVTPELARVGMTEAEARAAGHEVQVARLDVKAIPRARVARDTVGEWKAVIDARTDRILGAALFGPDAGEVVTAVQMAMRGGLTAAQVRDTVISHPTMGEGLNLLFAAPRT